MSLDLTLGEAIVCRLKEAGINTIFGIPGTHVIELYRGFDRFNIRPVTPRHEQTVGFAATAWSQLTGLPGVAVTTSGPGLLNVFAAAATAYCESRALIILSPGVPTTTPPGRIGILHETKNSVEAANSVVHWSQRAESTAHALQLLEKALVRPGERPAPVHIEIPIDLLSKTLADYPQVNDGAETSHLTLPKPAHHQLREAAELLCNAESPRILAGGGAAHAAMEIQRLAETTGAPVATTINGKGILDEHHPLALGSELRLNSLHCDIETADVLLVIGSKLAEAEFWSGAFQPSGKVIRIDIDPEQIQVGLESTPDLTLLGDSREIVSEIIGLIDSRSPKNPTKFEKLKSQITHEAELMGGPTLTLARRIESWIPSDEIVSMDSSQICYLGMNTARACSRPNQMLQAATYSPLGMGLPGAIGAAVAQPQKKTWCVTGDGALMFSVQELITAAEESLNITVVIVDNGGYREIAENMVDADIRPQGVHLLQPDWTALGRSLGAETLALDANATTSEFNHAKQFANEQGLRVLHIHQGPVEKL